MFTFYFYIFVYAYTCNDMRSVMLPINEYDDDDDVCSSKKASWNLAIDTTKDNTT